MKLYCLSLFILFIGFTVQAQGVGIGTTSPAPSAALDVVSDTSGILVPRMTAAMRDAITNPNTGLLVFVTSDSAFYYFDGAAWTTLTNRTRMLADTDGDTKVEVERVMDEDLVRFQVQGKDVMHIDSSGLRLAASEGSVYIGLQAGVQTVPSGSMENTFVGDSAGSANVDGTHNTFIGSSAGAQNTNGTHNTFVGFAAGQSNSGGISNTFVGYQAGTNATLGLGNAFFGHQAGLSNTGGGLNTFIGAQSGESIVNTNRNVFVGNSSGQHSTGSDNTLLGYKAGQQINGPFGNSDQNVIVGSEAGLSEVGSANTFVGYSAGRNNSNAVGGGFRNVFVGSEAGLDNLGKDNVFLGFRSGSSVYDGFYNVMVGSEAGRDATGQGNVLIGFQAGQLMDSVDHSVMIGYRAGINNAGDGNTFIGGNAGIVNVSGENNTFIGSDAGLGNNGTNNTFIGRNTGSIYSGQDGNTFIGSHSGWYNLTAANDNTFVGVSSGAFNRGSRNTFIGYIAGLNNDTGSDNVYLGHGTGLMNTTGQQNTYLGKDAGHDATGSGNVCIGYQAGYNANGNQKLYIDNSNTSSPLIYGDFESNALDITGTMRIAENPFGSGVFVDGSGMEFSYIDVLNTGYISVRDEDLVENTNGHLWLGHSVMIGVLSQDPSHRFTMPNNSVFGAALAYTWDTYSDSRIKSAIRPLQYGLAEVLALKPRSYFHHNTCIEHGNIKLDGNGLQRCGFIAQEVFDVIPEAVRVPVDENRALWSMDYDTLIPVLVKAIQELSAQVDQLQAEVNAIRSLY